MRLVRQLVALSLALLWVPSTVHCALEAAGMLPLAEDAATSTCCDPAPACGHHGCSAVEDGDYRTTDHAVRALPPFLVLGTVDEADLITRLIAANCMSTSEAPPDPRQPVWVGQWTFVRRAAGLSRAPSILNT